MNMNKRVLPDEVRADMAFPSGHARGSSSSSPICMHGKACLCALLATISLCCPFMMRSAHAATWPVSVSELSATCTFRQTYTAGDESYAHSGLDIPASAGMQISSPLAGTVRFTGAVPSGDSRTGGSSSEKTMNAVSIEVAGGKTITLMPLATICVSEGQAVAEGEAVGTLAQAGDVSSAGAHLHIGYKRQSTYLDPMQLFGLSSQESSSQGQEGLSASASSAAVPASPAASLAEELASSVSAQELAQAGQAPATSPAVESFGVIETGKYSLPVHSSEQIDPISLAGRAIEPLAAACYGQLSALVEALASLSRGTGIPLPALLFAMFVLAAAAAFALLFASVHMFLPRVRNIWRIQKGRLSACGRGDSMHKLFPASGAAFMSRSRIARGR